MPVVVRSATADDIPAVWACVDAVARERKYLVFTQLPPLDEARLFYQGLLDRRAPFVIAVDEPRVVGWCDMQIKAPAPLAHTGVVGMGVLPDWRGRGIGRRLLSLAIEKARERGLTRIELTVFQGNERARRLYEALGFQVEGLRRRVRKVDGVYDDDVMMALLLDDDQARAGLSGREN